MNNEESQGHPLGENKQWYEKYPERLLKEKELMGKYHPDFRFDYDEAQNAFWEGEVTVKPISTEYGSLDPKINHLKVRLVTRRSYPLSFPEVQDLNEVMKTTGCPHIFLNGNGLCYAFGTATDLDFERIHYIKDLYPVIQEFLFKQAVYEAGHPWPDEQLHQTAAFVMAEFQNGCIKPSEMCPCRLQGKIYAECHLSIVENYTEAANNVLSRLYGRRKLGRNSLCPCGNSKKFKNCCLEKKYFGIIRNHIITIYRDLPESQIYQVLRSMEQTLAEEAKNNKLKK